jgi:Zn-dependent peptidase ImmA (M78 family)
MKLNDLYNVAEKEKIKIYDWYIENANGAFINIDKINAIALNYNELGTSIDEKETLSEELGHYYMDATYPLECNDIILIEKQEYRARKWSYNVLIPFEDLKLAIKKRNR